MRHLGIDYGTKNIGIALSDEDGRMAFPYAVLQNNPRVFGEIRRVCENEKVEKIILGLPLDMQGQETAMTGEARDFKTRLYEETGLPVIFRNEILSSKEAEHFQGKHKKIDASAAALILNDYLQNN